MTNTPQTPGVAAGRLSAEALSDNFGDLHPAYDGHEAMVAADRCYFCYDAPCITACPTSIDIPLFIRQIQAGHPEGAAKTIFDQNTDLESDRTRTRRSRWCGSATRPHGGSVIS